VTWLVPAVVMLRGTPTRWVSLAIVTTILICFAAYQPLVAHFSYPAKRIPGTGRIIAVCCEFCGGLSDRVRGISYAHEVATLTGRTLEVDESVFHKRKAKSACKINRSSTLYRLIDRPPSLTEINELNDFKDVYFECNIDASAEYVHSHGYQSALEMGSVAAREHIPCKTRALSYADSVVHRFGSDFTVLHLRTGGSNITIGGHVMKTVQWEDGHGSGLPDALLQYAKRIPSDCACKTPLVIVSDSSRLVSELQMALYGKITVFSQGSQAVHMDRPRDGQTEECDQSIFDLAVMSSAREIIGTHGRFGQLGAVLFAKTPVPFFQSKDADAVMKRVLRSTGCSCMNTVL